MSNLSAEERKMKFKKLSDDLNIKLIKENRNSFSMWKIILVMEIILIKSPSILVWKQTNSFLF